MSEPADLQQEAELFRRDYQKLRDGLAAVLVGQDETLGLTLAALFGGGHVLLDGPPGIGKTLLGRTLAELIDTDYRRIQFTSDLMPADIIGTYVIMESAGRRRFEFQHGPIFTNLLLADEINRATPKTQAALFEALEERALTVANERYPLPEPFFAIATQSLGDIEGTFPIPETQKDRFFFKLDMSVLDQAALTTVLQRSAGGDLPRTARVLDSARLAEMIQWIRRLPVADSVVQQAARLVMATHPQNQAAPRRVRRFVLRGASPRAGQAMLLAAKVLAIVAGREEVRSEDLRMVALPALRHRIALNFEGHAEEAGIDGIVAEVVDAVK
ncbi:MAG: MoxR family ATPase [Planctomycetaceae bacterium]|nr:MAG: MoxR family ATPase [Planctomycetaceae bacterium]